MKRIIQPISEFECELTSEKPDVDYEPNPYFRHKTRPSFKLTKPARCIVRYEAEPDDGLTIAHLLRELKTPLDVANHRATEGEARRSQERLDFFMMLLGKAQTDSIEFMDGMKYIETSDSCALHAHDEYRYNNGGIEQVFPCKAGEPLIQKLNTETLTFENLETLTFEI